MRKNGIRAILLPAAPMQFVKNVMGLVLVYACLSTKETHTQVADLNVSSILIAPVTEHVSITNVKILVPELAD